MHAKNAITLLFVAASVGLLVLLANILSFTSSLRSKGSGERIDAIIICAGGQTPSGPPPHVSARLIRAAALYRDEVARGGNPVVITTAWGTPHKPCPRDAAGFEIHEAEMNARVLLRLGVPPDAIREESVSLETVGNAYFARTMHCDPLQLQRVVVVNNAWHMPRTKAVFSFVFSLPGATTYDVHFEEVEDALPPDVLAARLAREAKATPKFSKGSDWQLSIRSMRDLHEWLFLENTAYATKRLTKTRKPIDADALKSY